MKRMDIFCSSPASTAICSSTDQRSVVRRSHKSLLDHHRRQTPRSPLHDLIDKPRQNRHVPCCSQLPINPKPYFEKSRKSTSCPMYKQASSTGELRRKSSADMFDLQGRRDGSSSYLMSETTSFLVDWFSENDNRVKRFVASEPTKAKFRSLSSNDSSTLLKSSSSTRSRHQEVVLRVSLHCKGCEGKVKKHLSKMEGVTSFSIDLATKKVTVIGDITPLGVLASVSKVKNAQLWSSPTSPSSPCSE